MNEAINLRVGARVIVRMPHDVAGWSMPEGAQFEGVVVAINGDSLDIRTPSGDVEPFDSELCQEIMQYQCLVA